MHVGIYDAEPVDEASLLLAVPPDPRRRLLVHRRIPIGIEQHQPVASDEVQSAPAGFAAVPGEDIEDDFLSEDQGSGRSRNSVRLR